MPKLDRPRAEDAVLLPILEKVAPGTQLGAAIDLIKEGKTGALIVLGDDPQVMGICNGGFELDTEFSEQRLSELAKMDGAVILSEEADRIRLANVHLVPSSNLPTSETGTRHRTAERVARQTGKMSIAVSQSREAVTLYFQGFKYVLEDIKILLAKANQALQTLDKYRHNLDRLYANLAALEFEDLVALDDVVTVLQRGEMIERFATEIRRHVTELGSEGQLISLQLDELIADVEEDLIMVIMDYKSSSSKRTPEVIRRLISGLDDDDLIDGVKVCALLGYRAEVNVEETRVRPKGYRLLSRVPRLPSSVAFQLGKKFRSLQRLMSASLEQLDEVEGVGEARARSIRDILNRLRESALLERY